MSAATLLGLAAAVFTTCAFLPQVIRAWRTHSTRDLSFQSFATYAIGLALWLTYGLIIGDLPLILSNGATFVLVLTLLGLKVKFG